MGNWVPAFSRDSILFVLIPNFGLMSKVLFYCWMVLFMLLCSCTSKTADKVDKATNDSIKKYLDLAGNDTLDSKLRNNYNDKAFSLVDLSKNDTLTRFYLSSLSYNYMRTREIIKYKNIAKFHLEKSKEAFDTLNLARYYKYKAGFFINTTFYDSAFFYLLKTEKYYKRLHEEQLLENIILNKGIIQFKVGDYLGAELSLLKAYSKYKASKNYYKTFCALNELGLLYNEMSDYKKSLFYHKKALDIVLNSNLKSNTHQNAVCYNNIGYLFLNQKKYNAANINFQLGLEDKKVFSDDPELYALLKSNLGQSKFEAKYYKESLKHFLDALKVENKLIGKSVLINIYSHLSEYYNNVGNYALAEKYANIALTKAIKSQNTFEYLNAIRQLSSVNKNYIPKYFEVYIKINDSFQIVERKARNSFARIQLETDEINQEKETAIKQKWIVGGIAGVVIIIIVLLLIITRQRSKQKELQFIQSQQNANEEIYDLMLAHKNKEDLARQSEKKRIALELHDGVMNRLASTRLNLNVLSHKKDKETIENCLIHVEGLYQIEQEIRNVAHDLNQEIFIDNNSFIILLTDFIANQNSITDTKYQIEIDKSIDWVAISSGIKMNLYRIIQEASHNINKFAEAKIAMISILLDENNLCLSITDDGKGFDAEKQTEGIGLKNIKQRVDSLNGKFVIQSRNKKSTSLNIAIPLK